MSAAWRQMVFYALIFSYTPRKSRDFVSEKLHGQTRLEGCIVKRFGSFWIRQDSHFSGKPKIPLKKSRVRHNPLWFALSCLGTSQGAVYREPDPPLSPISDQQGNAVIGKNFGIRLRGPWWDCSLGANTSQRMYIMQKLSQQSLIFPFFLLSPLPCWALKDIASQVSGGEKLKHECVGQLV